MMTLGRFLLCVIVQKDGRASVIARSGLTAGGVSHHLRGVRMPGPRAREVYRRVCGIDPSAWDRAA